MSETVLPIIKPVRRTFMAAVQAKKTVSDGIGATKFEKDDDNVKSPMISNMEKTRYAREINPVIVLGL